MANLVTIDRARQVESLADLADDHLSSLLAFATRAFQSACGRSIVADSRVETHDGGGINSLFLDETPITDIAKIVFEYDGVDDEEFTDSDQWNYDADSGEVWFRATASAPAGRFPRGRQNIVVHYTGGYAEGSIPEDVQHAVLLIAQKGASDNETDLAMGSESLEGAKWTRRSAAGLTLPPEAMDIAMRYRTLWFGSTL
jgi:hypothetical protein